MYNPSLRLKHIFIRFAQALFSQRSPVIWKADPKDSEIIIADKFATDFGMAAKRPIIVFDRGDLTLNNAVIGQSSVNATNLIAASGYGPVDLSGYPDAGYDSYRTFSDLVTTTITYQIVGSNGPQIEDIAGHLFSAMVLYKAEFISAGIKSINFISMGREQLISAKGGKPELIGVTISAQLRFGLTVSSRPYLYNSRVYVHDDRVGSNELLENYDYTISEDGKTIRFSVIPVNPTITYTDGVTLEIRENVALENTGDPLIFTLPGSDTILSYYTRFNNFTPNTAT